MSDCRNHGLAATPAPVTISLLSPADQRSLAIRREVPAAQQYLFDGQIWSSEEDPSCSVEVVAVAATDGHDVGLATLGRVSPLDEEPDKRVVSVIFGLWVAPAARNKGVGTALLVALAAESQRRYRMAPQLSGVTAEGMGTIRAARRDGAEFDPGD